MQTTNKVLQRPQSGLLEVLWLTHLHVLLLQSDRSGDLSMEVQIVQFFKFCKKSTREE